LETKLANHQKSIEQLDIMQKQGNEACKSWESKMRKHISKRKKLMAQSSQFESTIVEIRSRISEESDQWSEVLKPLIAEAISELQSLHEHLSQK